MCRFKDYGLILDLDVSKVIVYFLPSNSSSFKHTNLVGISMEFSGPNLKQANPGCSSGESTESPLLLIFLLLNLGPTIQSKTLRL